MKARFVPYHSRMDANFAFIFENSLELGCHLYVMQRKMTPIAYINGLACSCYYKWQDGVLVPVRKTDISQLVVAVLLKNHYPPIPGYYWTRLGWQKDFPGYEIEGAGVIVEEE